jgi:hypothetical protein
VGQQISRRDNARRLSPSDLRTTLPEVRPASDIKDLHSHTPAKATTDGKEQLAAVAHPTAHVEDGAGHERSPIGAESPEKVANYVLEAFTAAALATGAAEELGVVMRTITRMRPKTVMFGGVAYVNREKLHQQIASGLKKRRPRR